ncbi:MAG: hypothetical protein AAGI10_11780 [Pseudomonadota bacterium]
MQTSPSDQSHPVAHTPGPEDITSLNETRAKVRNMLTRSKSFMALPPDQRAEVAHDTVKVFHFLGDQAPEQMLSAPHAAPMAAAAPARAMNDRIRTSDSEFKAEAAREGAFVAGAMLNSVKFVDFVAGLIENVYVAIVDASIKQMEAYAQMVSSVAKSVDDFKRDNITTNQGRDHVVDTFPDLFEISTEGDFFGNGVGEPRVAPRSGVDESEALDRVAKEYNLQGEDRPRDLSSETLESIIVPAAEMQLALSRQRLLATTLVMGINKIVVTDGRISAKVMYNFRSQDSFSRNRKATDFDYGKQRNISRSGEWDYGRDASESESSTDADGNTTSSEKIGDRWSKGNYQYSNTPVIEMKEVVAEQSVGNLEASAALAGSVDINFKSETVNLDQIASTFQMGQIQDAAGMMDAARGSPGTAASQPPQQSGNQQQPTNTQQAQQPAPQS